MSDLDDTSRIDVSTELTPAAAGRPIRTIFKEGHNLSFSDHAIEELEKDDLDMVDVVNVLRAHSQIDRPEPHIKTGP